MAPVTILQVGPRLDTGGSELATLEIAEALTRAGAKALVVSEGGRMAKAIVQGGGEVIEMQVANKNPLTIWRNARRLTRLIRDRGVDLIHARSRAPPGARDRRAADRHSFRHDVSRRLWRVRADQGVL